MVTDTIRVLMIEDNMGDARLISEMIKEVRRVNIKLEHSLRLTTGLERLSKGGIDVVLLDLGLPDSTGLDSLKKVGAVASTIPVVVLTGFEDEEIGLKAVQLGAQDYLIKLQIDSNLLVRCLRYAIERKRMDQKLQEKEEENQAILDALPDLIFQLNKEGMFLSFKGFNDDIFPAWDVYKGKSIYDYYPSEIAEKTMYHLKESLSSCATQIYEYQLTTDNILHSYESRMVLNGQDKVLVIVRNVGEKKISKQIERSNSSFE
jgi:DNA-binding NarL/FixJ family response regulator